MSARPGRIIVDREIALPGDVEAGVRDITGTATLEFQALKTELAKAIYTARI